MREREIGIVPIIEVAPRIDVLTQVFCVRTFSMGRKEGGTAHRRPHTSFLCEDFFVGGNLWNLNDGVACFE